ncbi:MAG: hypothetical protein ISR65_07545 [Bacteriovoracaceae bacterium]|nr:hypothetical protein [Bacteriovoracaceae bacterium]
MLSSALKYSLIYLLIIILSTSFGYTDECDPHLKTFLAQIHLHSDNAFVNLSKGVARVNNIEELKEFVRVNLEKIKNDVDKFSSDEVKRELSIWIDLQNNNPVAPYIIGGSPMHTAKNIEELAQDYLSQVHKNGSMIINAVRNIQNIGLFQEVLFQGGLDDNLSGARRIFVEYISHFRAELLLLEFTKILDAQ